LARQLPPPILKLEARPSSSLFVYLHLIYRCHIILFLRVAFGNSLIPPPQMFRRPPSHFPVLLNSTVFRPTVLHITSHGSPAFCDPDFFRFASLTRLGIHNPPPFPGTQKLSQRVVVCNSQSSQLLFDKDSPVPASALCNPPDYPVHTSSQGMFSLRTNCRRLPGYFDHPTPLPSPRAPTNIMAPRREIGSPAPLSPAFPARLFYPHLKTPRVHAGSNLI